MATPPVASARRYRPRVLATLERFQRAEQQRRLHCDSRFSEVESKTLRSGRERIPGWFEGRGPLAILAIVFIAAWR
jgi:hypothetical protein